jgi:hypothetical protein
MLLLLCADVKQNMISPGVALSLSLFRSSTTSKGSVGSVVVIVGARATAISQSVRQSPSAIRGPGIVFHNYFLSDGRGHSDDWKDVLLLMGVVSWFLKRTFGFGPFSLHQQHA